MPDEKRSAPLPYRPATETSGDNAVSGSSSRTNDGSGNQPQRPQANTPEQGERRPASTRATQNSDQDSADARPTRDFAPTVELPKAGGALRSLGEKFQPNPFTGTGTLAVPIAVSPGRGGFGPQLSLGYSSGAGNGPFGLGWGLDVPSITRKTDKGIPLYEDGRESDVFILSGAEDLVPIVDGDAQWGEESEWGDLFWGEGGDAIERISIDKGTHIAYRYRPRIEGLFARIEQWVEKTTGDIHWRAVTRDNVTSIYGQSHSCRVSNPDDDGADAPRTFRWLLEETFDDRGNFIVYEYKQEDLDNVDQNAICEQNRLADTTVQAQHYLKRIKYGNGTQGQKGDWMFEVVLDYGEHGTWNSPASLDISTSEDRTWPTRSDTFSTYRAGFEVRTRRLCRRVLMFHHFDELASSPAEGVLVSSTDFDYEENPAVTYLIGVTQRGYLRDDVVGDYAPSDIPTLDLTYQKPVIDSSITEVDQSSLENIPQGVDGGLFRFVDVNGEGLPGVLTEQGGGWFYKRPLGDGRYGPMVALPSQPSSATLGGGARLMDVTGDGMSDLVVFTQPSPGYYARTQEDGWDPQRSFQSIPNVDWQDPNLQLLDISGDGFPDVLISKDDHFIWYRSKGAEGFDHPRRVHKPKDERSGAAIVFADPMQSIQLADMTGDGLTDIVRIRNGETCYWPSLGHGRFARKITLDNSPVFDHPDQFDPKRIRLADIDGTGTTDIIYLGRNVTKLYFSEAGNAFADEQTLDVFPIVDALANVQVVDLKGTGTACLVWSHPSGDSKTGSLRYIDLMGGEKPHLLTASNNNMGAETRVAYASSTKFYLQDRDAGTPWLTKLPFPVQVLERVESYDHIANTKLVNHFRYHHGHYDGVEREFRGFAMVEQWDTESFDEFGGSSLFTFDDLETVEQNLHQPPVYTKTWFHTGAYFGRDRVSTALVDEYYAGDQSAVQLPDTILPLDIGAHESREACRALKGSAIRQEVYALDGTASEADPYTVAETNFTIIPVQPKGFLRHAVFFVHPRETLTYNYERDAADPRIAHSVVVEIDSYGAPTKTVSVGYPRRGNPAESEQSQRSIVLSEAKLAHDDQSNDYFRHSTPYEAKTYELHNVSDTTVPLAFDTVVTAVNTAIEVPYDEDPVVGLKKRLLTHQKSFFYKNDLTGVLPFGQSGQRALPTKAGKPPSPPTKSHRSSATTPPTACSRTRAATSRSPACGGPSLAARSSTQTSSTLPTSSKDPFGNTYTVTYDTYALLIESTSDPLSNQVSVDNDYRVLAPTEITDPNGNRSAVELDGLGVPVKTAVMGKTTESLGDSLSDPTTKLSYDLFAWQNDQTPNWIHTEAREEHQNVNTPWQESYVYFDGSGRVIMTKVQAEPGLAPERDQDGDLVLVGSPAVPNLVETSPAIRWVGTGRTVFDNKGNPVKQYEPYFSSIPDFEDEAELVQQGVTPVLHYDPLGRLIRTDLPNGTYSKVEFNPWEQVTHDPNDTVLDSDWYDQRYDYQGADEDLLAEKRAAQLTVDHDSTPTTAHLDHLGRVFLTVQHNGFGSPDPIEFETRVKLDVQGNPLEIIDARQAAMQTPEPAQTDVYGMLGQSLETDSHDAGERKALTDIVGNPLRAFDERGFISRAEYDELLRPTHSWVTTPTSPPVEMLVSRVLYGEDLTTPDAKNHRGRVYRVYDTAGELTNNEFDFKGNLLKQTRKLATEYETTQDWVALENASPPSIANIATEAANELESESFVVESTYDALNRVVTQKTPDDSETQLTYNEASLLESVDVKIRGAASATNFVTDIDYNARGQRTLITYGNDTETTYEYDAETFRLTRLTTDKTSSPTKVLQDLRYTYDPVGNIVEIRDDAQQTVYYDNTVVSPDQKFEYDPLYRLTSATGREHTSLGQMNDSEMTPSAQPHPDDPAAMRLYTETYEYDEVGNILKMVHSATGGNWTRGYHYDDKGNRLLKTSLPGDTVGVPGTYSASYTYDVHGNMDSMPHLSGVDWDFADQMQHCDLGGGGDVWFVYDGTGQRVRKVWANSSGSLVKERIYLGPYEVYREHKGSPMIVDLERETLHVSDDTGRICMVETKTVENGSSIGSPTSKQRFQYSNHLGTAALEVDESGGIISYEEYHPFGSTSYHAKNSQVDVSAKRYRYTGKERDDETGLYYHGARYYACWLGRWTAADPIGLGDGVNRFAYVSNNPVRLNDPGGTEKRDVLLQQIEANSQALANATAGSDEATELLIEQQHLIADLFAAGGGKGSSKGPKVKSRGTSADQENVVVETIRDYGEGEELISLEKGGAADVSLQLAGAVLQQDLKSAVTNPKRYLANETALLGNLIRFDERFNAGLENISSGETFQGVVNLGFAGIEAVGALASGLVGGGGNKGGGKGGLPGGGGNPGGGGPTKIRGFHGSRAESMVNIVKEKHLRPKNEQVDIATEAGQTFLHGTDREKGVSLSLEFDAFVERAAARIERLATPGSPDTIRVHTKTPVKIKPQRLHIRKKNPDFDPEDVDPDVPRFLFDIVEGADAIADFLRNL